MNPPSSPSPDPRSPWPEGTQLYIYRWYDPRTGVTRDPAIEMRVFINPRDFDSPSTWWELRSAISQLMDTIGEDNDHGPNESPPAEAATFQGEGPAEDSQTPTGQPRTTNAGARPPASPGTGTRPRVWSSRGNHRNRRGAGGGQHP